VGFHEAAEIFGLHEVEDLTELFVSMYPEAIGVPAEAIEVVEEGDGGEGSRPGSPVMNSFFCTRQNVRFDRITKVHRTSDRRKHGVITLCRHWLNWRRVIRDIGGALALAYARCVLVE